jgi:hypothetical protein
MVRLVRLGIFARFRQQLVRLPSSKTLREEYLLQELDYKIPVRVKRFDLAGRLQSEQYCNPA